MILKLALSRVNLPKSELSNQLIVDIEHAACGVISPLAKRFLARLVAALLLSKVVVRFIEQLHMTILYQRFNAGH